METSEYKNCKMIVGDTLIYAGNEYTVDRLFTLEVVQIRSKSVPHHCLDVYSYNYQYSVAGQAWVYHED